MAHLHTVRTVSAASVFPGLFIPVYDSESAEDGAAQYYDHNHICNIHHIPIPIARSISRTRNAVIHATKHCHKTTPAAHLPPSSRLMDAIAATHGVYSSEKISMAAADAWLSAVVIPSANRISMVETTLSFAINPLIRDRKAHV